MSRDTEPRRHVDRAAQFMPFAALTGYYDLVRQRTEAAARTNWDELGHIELGAPADRPAGSPTPGDSARRSRPGRP